MRKIYEKFVVGKFKIILPCVFMQIGKRLFLAPCSQTSGVSSNIVRELLS